ncbi:hypothetical protein DXG03_002650 [Asterophora parasitica]|uniref:Uncharacterized protein n=1 Tax=Asterophora parasitica TaxID=117018 RepID=A0A9P7GG06_9AGAR|nr:hypothetical protein DXG03_002650 [Asterophora parasitica]
MGQIHTTNDANTYLQSQPAHGAISEQPAQRGSSTNVGFPEATVLGKPSSQYHGVSSAQSKGPTSASHTAVQSASHPFVATKAYVTSSLPYTLAPALRNQQPSQQDYSRAVPTIVQPTMDHITYQKARFDQSATHSLVALKGSDSESTAYVHAQPSGAQPITKRQSQQYKTTEPVASHSGEKTSQSFGLSKGVATAAQPSTASHTRDQKIYDTTKTSVQELNTEGHMFPSQHPQMPTIAAFQTYPAHRDEQPSHSYDTLKNINNPLPLPSLSASRLSSNPEVTSVLPNGDSKLHSASQHIYAAPVDHLVALGPDIITAVPSAVPVPANYSSSRENLPTPGQPMIPPPRTVSRAGFKDRHNPAPTYHLPKPIVEDLPSLSQPQPPVSRGAINNETFVPYAPGERSKAGHSSQEYPVPQRSEHLEKLANYRSVADRPSQATQHLVTEHSGLQAYRAPIQHAQLAELLSSPAPLNTRERAPVNITGVGVLSSIATPSQPLQADVASLSTRPYAIPPQPVLCTAKGRHSPSKAPHDVDNYPNITRASVQLAHSIPPQPGTSISQAHHSPPKALDEADSQLNVARAQPSHAMPLQQVPSASNARLSPSKVPDEIDNRPSVARTIHAIPQQPVPSSSRVRHSPSKPPREVDNRPIVLDVAEPRKVQSESNRHPPSPKGSIRQISAQPLPPPSHTHSREPSTSPQPSRTDPHLEQRHVLSEPAKSAPPPQPSSHRVPEPQPLSSRNRELGRSSHKQQPASASSTFPAHLEKSAQPTETPSTAPPVPPIGHRVTEPKPPSSRNHEPSKSTHKQQSASASYTYPAHLEKSAPQIETSSTAPPVAPTSHRVPEPQPPSSRNHEPSKSTHKQQSASASYTYPAHLEKSAPQIETSSTAPPVAPTSHRVPEPQPSSRNREPGRSSHKQQPALALSTYPAHLEKGTPQIETPSAVPPVPPIVTEPQPPSSRNHDPGPSSHKQQFASASSTYPAHLLHTETPSTAPSVPPTSHKVIETQPSSLRNPDPSKASHKQQSASTSHNLSASTYPIQSSASRSQPTTTEMNHRTQRTDSSRPRERTTSGPSNDLAASNVDPSSSRHVPSSLYTSQARAPRTQSVSIPSTNVPPPAVEATTAFRTQPTTSTRTIIPPPNSELRSDAVPQAHVSSSARVPASGPLPTSYRPTKVSKKTSEDSILKTPSSLAPSTLKPTVSRTSIPASLSSQPERKRGLFSIFRTKSSQAPALTEEVVPERTRKDSKEKKGLLRKAEVSSTEKLPPPGDTKVRDTNVVSSLAARVNPPPPITVPIPINPSTTPDRMSPNSKPFTPFRYLTQKRNRTMSAASLEAQDGTAPNTVVGSPTASMHSTQPPIQPPPLRDPFIATQEWRKQEAAEIREVATGKWRRARPGVVFDVEEDPRDDQKRRPVPRVKPSTPKADSPKTENSS